MDTVGFCVFLALSSVLAANVAAEWPLIDTIFMRFYNRTTNSHTDTNLANARDMVPLLDKSQKTAIFIHGYLEHVEIASVKTVTQALLDFTSDNVISVDYAQIASQLYTTSVAYAPHVGVAVAAALIEMVKAGLDETTIHLIGHSLGAQISGYIGRNTTFRIPRITGLDPAGPLFVIEYLSKADALFVCIIHTDMYGYGTGYISGNVHFRPNFGYRIQPGCILELPEPVYLAPDLCSHQRSWKFFAESVANANTFPSVKCDSPSDFRDGTCDTRNILPMGYYTPANASGVYYCQTNPKGPYNLGMAGTMFNSSIL